MTYHHEHVNKTLEFQLVLTPDQIERMYEGSARAVVCTSTTGQVIRFPLNILRPFITRSGINGRFKITFDKNFKFKSLHQL